MATYTQMFQKLSGLVDTDKWYPVVILDGSQVGVAGIAFGSVTAKYFNEGNGGWTAYTVTTAEWQEVGDGVYEIKIGAGEFPAAGLYTVFIDAGESEYLFSVEVTVLSVETHFTDIKGTGFVKDTHSLTDVVVSIGQATAIRTVAASQTITAATIDNGGFATTQVDDGIYFQTSPEDPATLDFYMEYDVGLGRAVDKVFVNGYFDSGALRVVNIDVWNWMTTQWEQISSGDNNMKNRANEADYEYFLNQAHYDEVTGKVRVRFKSTSTTVGDDLYLDYVYVSSVSAGGLTVEEIAEGVWRHDVVVHLDHDSAGFFISQYVVEHGEITGVTSQKEFATSDLTAVDGIYNDTQVMLHDEINNQYCVAVIDRIDAAGNIVLKENASLTLSTDFDLYILSRQSKEDDILMEMSSALESGDLLINNVSTTNADLEKMKTEIKNLTLELKSLKQKIGR